MGQIFQPMFKTMANAHMVRTRCARHCLSAAILQCPFLLPRSLKISQLILPWSQRSQIRKRLDGRRAKLPSLTLSRVEPTVFFSQPPITTCEYNYINELRLTKLWRPWRRSHSPAAARGRSGSHAPISWAEASCLDQHLILRLGINGAKEEPP